MNPINISMVKNATSTTTKDSDAAKIIERVRSGKWRVLVERIRSEYHHVLAKTGDLDKAKKAVNHLKKALPCALPSGSFFRRTNSCLTKHSGLLCADLDNLGNRLPGVFTKLGADPHVFAVFVSPTGTGLKAWFRVPPAAALHLASYRAVERQVQQLVNVQIDAACKDVARACFVSFDPEAHLNVNAIELAPLIEDPKPATNPANPVPAHTTDTRRRSAVELLGEIQWISDSTGFCTCPGQHMHTTGNGPRDCKVHLDGAPTISCFHSHCRGSVEEANHELRSRIGRAEGTAQIPVKTKPSSSASEYFGNAEAPAHFELPPAPQWPAPMHAAAFRGLAGAVVRTIEPHTEADPAAVLVLLLAAFGNMAGPGAHFVAEARHHPLRIWPVLVGETAKGRKGSAWSSLRHVLELTDPTWCAGCTTSGLSSGEGLIWRVRDPITRTKRNKDGTSESYIEDEGVADKRVFCMEEEFSVVLKVAAREGNTISDLLRRAWDHGNLASLTKNSPARATGAHVTVAGHITTPELRKLLPETDALNGFGNRFLWLAVRRSKLLPEGGALASADLGDLVLDLRRALDHVRTATLFERTHAARDFWRQLYPVLTSDRGGLLGAITNRAEAYVMRLAVAYAALDLARVVDVTHLQSALAVWDYCQRSAAFIFGESLGDRITDRLLDELRAAGESGLPQTEIRRAFSNNISARALAESLALLERLVLARKLPPPAAAKGRPPVVWAATPYAENATNAESPPAGAVNAFSAFLASGYGATTATLPAPVGAPAEEARVESLPSPEPAEVLHV